MQEKKYLNYEVIHNSEPLYLWGRILFQDIKCSSINAEVFQRYTNILVEKDSRFQGVDYESTINNFVALKGRIQSLHSQKDDDDLQSYNIFAQEQCKVLYQMFLNKPFDSEL
jgi:hypothetical protein